MGARKRFDSQEFVFGTCSQLERTGEDGPGENEQSRTVLDGQNGDYYDQLPPPSTSVARRGFLKTLAIDRKAGSSLRSGSWEIGNRVNEEHDVSVADVRKQPVRQRESQSSKFQGTGGRLWNAAARDPSGGLLDVEFVDMTGGDDGNSGCLEPSSTRRKEDNDLLRGVMGTAAIRKSATPNDAEESCQSIRRAPQIEGTVAARKNDPVQIIRGPRDSSQTIKLMPTSATLLLAPHTINPVSIRPPGDSSRSISSRAATPAVAHVEMQPNPPSPVLNPVEPKTKKSKQPKPPVMPDFQSYHLTKLKTEVTKFGFKNMRTRERMISCLERCWEAQNKTATAAVRSSAQPETNDSGPVANTTGLQRGTNEEETVPVLHLQDDPVIVPPPKKPRACVKQKKTEKEKATPKSPKRKAAPKKKLPPKAVSQPDDGTIEFIDLSAEPNSPERKGAPKARARKTPVLPSSPKSAAFKPTELHCRISKVVRESGRIGSKFSFYHSILMYDPIILEDIASWLNSMFYPEKVDVEDVKAWCETNGVCCVRSESLKVQRVRRKKR